MPVHQIQPFALLHSATWKMNLAAKQPWGTYSNLECAFPLLHVYYTTNNDPPCRVFADFMERLMS